MVGEAASLEVKRLTPAIGAEVRGLDLSKPLTPGLRAAVREAWLEHLVLFFPNQPLEPDEQVRFAEQFGEVTPAHPVEPAHPENPDVLPIDSRKDRVDFWHTDVTFMARPPTGAVLCAQVVPETGGDTMWANLRLAYETLAPALQQLCDGLRAYHYDETYAARLEAGEGNEWEGERLTKLVPVEHPVVRVHPETGRKGLFVNPTFTKLLSGFPGDQSAALLRLLYEHSTRPEFVCRYRWSEGTVAFWDNRDTMHYGLFDFGDARRVMHRVTLRGEAPAGVTVPAADAGQSAA
jgi:alpha-ketoglutarate-dependent taurine dioxygenase